MPICSNIQGNSWCTNAEGVRSGIMPCPMELEDIVPPEILEETHETWPCHVAGPRTPVSSGVMPLDIKEERRSLQMKICELLAPLPREERKILWLRFERGLSNEDIARRLRCKPSQIGGKLVGALRHARRLQPTN